MRWRHLIGVMMGCILLMACSHVTPDRVQRKVVLTVQAAPDINPDDKARPAPVLVQLYEMKTAAVFDTADFFALNTDAVGVLGQDLLAREEIIMQPGQRRQMKRRLHADVAVIGVVVAYRELDKSVWRAKHVVGASGEMTWWRALLPDKTLALHLHVGSNTFHVSTGQGEEDV